jgi:hypothetical protein
VKASCVRSLCVAARARTRRQPAPGSGSRATGGGATASDAGVSWPGLPSIHVLAKCRLQAASRRVRRCLKSRLGRKRGESAAGASAYLRASAALLPAIPLSLPASHPPFPLQPAHLPHTPPNSRSSRTERHHKQPCPPPAARLARAAAGEPLAIAFLGDWASSQAFGGPVEAAVS